MSGLPDHRIYGLGDKDNFWQMGDTGPCGPCTEIFVDLEWTGGRSDGRTVSEEVIPQAEFEKLAEAGRFLEIWNLVFMQFDRSADGTLTPLPKPSVDTGAGLERIAAVMQGEDDNFHTDVFQPLIDRVGELVGRPYDRNADERASYRVLADHARAVSFLLADGVYPDNEGRGYVLRRILRRAVRHAWLLGRREPTLALLTEVVVGQMGEVYPELAAKAAYIREVTETEEQRFLQTIEGGLRRLEEIFASGARVIPGEDAFKLYDTFGFPIDLTGIIAEERGVAVDTAGFDRALQGPAGALARRADQREDGRRPGGAHVADREVAERQARQAEVRRLPDHRGRHRHPGIPPGGAARGAGAAREPVLRRVGRTGERRRRSRGAGLVAARGRGAEGPQGHRGGRHASRRPSSPTRSGRRWTHPGATTSSGTTAPRTWSTTRSGSTWAPTCGSRARWCSPIGCGSTSRTMARSTPTPCTPSSRT